MIVRSLDDNYRLRFLSVLNKEDSTGISMIFSNGKIEIVGTTGQDNDKFISFSDLVQKDILSHFILNEFSVALKSDFSHSPLVAVKSALNKIHQNTMRGPGGYFCTFANPGNQSL